MAETELPTTQRAYTLRLSGDRDDPTWRDALWATHEAVNRGTAAFGGWLLTLRGGLDHRLADLPVRRGKSGSERPPTDEERRDRRILLALSWLSVESAAGAPARFVIEHEVDSSKGARRDWRTVDALRRILRARDLTADEVESWVADCSASLSARIRERRGDEVVWVDRRAAFAAALVETGTTPSQEDVWDLLGRFFRDPAAYLSPAAMGGEAEDDEEAQAAEEPVRDHIQQAGQWLSSRFGTGAGADFGRMADAYTRIGEWAGTARPGRSGTETVADLASALGDLEPATPDLEGVLGLVSGPGHKSATRNLLTRLHGEPSVAAEMLERLGGTDTVQGTAAEDAEKCCSKVGEKGPRPYADAILADVEQACGFTYLQEGGPAKHSEFAVMLDHAARRVAAGHSWIKRAEAERRRFTSDAERRLAVPEPARAWLDAYCERRTVASGALSGYRIRPRAVGGWKQVVAAWASPKCRTQDDRVQAARSLQDDREIDKFGDIQFFEALAADDATCVWAPDGAATERPLLDFVAATEAEDRRQRFKVPAYCHPDPLRHPVFCDFGFSRWSIRFAAHEAANGREKAAARFDRSRAKAEKLAARVERTPGRDASAVEAKLAGAREEARNAEADLAWLDDLHALRLGLWSGSAWTTDATGRSGMALRWHSKRLPRALGLVDDAPDARAAVSHVARADRLGRAAVGAGPSDRAVPVGLFEQKDWNGRLQAPRRQLDALAARVREHGWDARAVAMQDRLAWFVTFSAKLRPQGPWPAFAEALDLNPNPAYRPHAEANRKRGPQAKLGLARLPGLRVLSVDLGHRYAAACAVWETLSSEDVRRAAEAAGRAAPSERNLHLLLPADGCARTTLYRRIAADTVERVDETTGEVGSAPHPAPWARLDRQFLVKLQGEDRSARRATDGELRAVAAFDAALGHTPARPRAGRVDALMSDAVRTARLAVARHGRVARVAYLLAAEKDVRNGRDLPSERRAESVLDGLVLWHGLVTQPGWDDARARGLWADEVQPLLAARGIALPDEEPTTGPSRRRRDTELRESLRPVAEAVARGGHVRLAALWTARWREDDGAWPRHLRWLRDWLLPRGRAARSRGIRDVGGLSVTRLATIRSLYQVQKAWRMRPEPDDLRKNVPVPGDTSLDDFGRSVLDALERMRENRVKQLASRIAEAALGVGVESPRRGGRDRPRPRGPIHVPASGDGDPRFAPCHAVVTENLVRYRPEETRTRRENRMLMAWSSAKVHKYLSEACTLGALHLRQVRADYTSRQDSRTGAPGLRCSDVPVEEFVAEEGWLSKRVRRACDAIAGGQGDAEARLLADLRARWDAETRTWTESAAGPNERRRSAASLPWRLEDADGKAQWRCLDGEAMHGHRREPRPVRIPQRGGELFVSADGASPAARGLQADLNAAANIGLRALLDPDWPGKWWSVPCEEATGCPVREKVAGSAAVDPGQPLRDVPGDPSPARPRRRRARAAPAGSNIVNLWRDVSSAPLTDPEGSWMPYAEYWNKARFAAVRRLRAWNGLP